MSEIDSPFNACQHRSYCINLKKDALPIADIEAEIAHIRQNGVDLAKFGDVDSVTEGRCRELCAMYLKEFVLSFRLKQELDAIDAARQPQKPERRLTR